MRAPLHPPTRVRHAAEPLSKTDEVYNKGTEEKSIAAIIIAKQRNGPIGDFRLAFRRDVRTFFDYEPRSGP